MYLCDPELEQGWNLRSNINYRGHDARDQELRMTLIRFLTSKGLKKDKEGVASLSDEEIRLVEHGIANVKYAKQGDMKARVHQVLWEFHHYQRTANPSGHSATQRIEYWKAAMGIIHKHPLFGVGTGDIKNAYDQQYAEMNSKLSEQWRLRAHNQYLSIAVAFGICGLLYFLVSLVVPLVGGWKASNSLYISFSIISIISFLTEDTLETQAGVTFFALFTGLFLFVNPSFRETGVNSGSDG
jgi:hypothetical protein